MLAVIIALSAAGVRELLEVACVGALVLVAIKSITINEAFAATQPRVLLTVISSFGIGRALLLTGLASWIAHGIVSATISGGACLPRNLFTARHCSFMYAWLVLAYFRRVLVDLGYLVGDICAGVCCRRIRCCCHYVPHLRGGTVCCVACGDR